VFKKETDPSKLGKSLSESINKKTIIGTLLILMVLPLLSRAEVDFSINYFLREIFWFGRSSCEDPLGFFCHPEEEKWLTVEGWNEILRGSVRAGENNDGEKKKVVLWMYIPDYMKKGTMNSIKSIPNPKGEEGNYWEETK
jgi:hypothetical protein